MAKIIEVIYLEREAGTGEPDFPIRRIPEYWSKEGELLFAHDPISGGLDISGHRKGRNLEPLG